jgi:flagellar hook assembly protein FlgD
MLTFPADSGEDRITICDIRGRVVRRIAIPTHALGLAQATWDGRDDRGALVPVGLYLAHRASGEALGRILMVER